LIQDKLENWARAFKDSRFHVVSCKSLESRYKSPQHWQPAELKAEYDLNDAIKTERAIIQLSKREQNIIVYNYIKNGYDFHKFCSKNKIKGSKELSKTDAFTLELNRIENILDNVLTR